MLFQHRLPTIFLLTISSVLVLLATGCGRGSSSADSTTRSVTNPASVESDKTEGNASTDTQSPSAEASVEEREAVSAVLAKSFTARAAADFAAQCSTLSQKAIAQIPGMTKSGDQRKACPATLKKAAMPLKLTAPIRKNVLTGPINSLRVRGSVGRAIFHGSDGKNYAITVEKERGTWKVGALVAKEI